MQEGIFYEKEKSDFMYLGCSLAAGGQQVWAATTHYNDSSATGGSAEWNAYVEGWNSLANDYTHVSITPGAADSQLNFAWYTEALPPRRWFTLELTPET